jgi:hypothetical protein
LQTLFHNVALFNARKNWIEGWGRQNTVNNCIEIREGKFIILWGQWAGAEHSELLPY